MYEQYYQALPESHVPKFSFTKGLILVIVFVLLTPVALGASAFSLMIVASDISRTDARVLAAKDTSSLQAGRNIYAALPDSIPSVASTIGTADARVDIIRNYLTRYSSPLVPYAQHIVDMADEYDIDFRLTTAIAQQESNLCKRIPPGTFNCWGWGIHSRGTLGFASFEEGIRVVTRGLRRNYIEMGLTTPEQIMTKYTPLSKGSWAFGVRLFMEQMQ